ncbi:MAG: hypothetical protein IKD76_07850 [Clostridia bacterium]|nr:hypothetical protein [Clostridia bacterium]
MKNIKARRICIICEGFEEMDYLNVLINKAVFSNRYDFVLINSKSIDSISTIYKVRYQSNSYDLVLVFCDTDKYPSASYNKLKDEINKFHDNNVAHDIVIFGNPCTMQIILSHFGEIKLTSQSKAINSGFIEKFTGIKNYKATVEQRRELFSNIKRDNYEVMKENVAKLSSDDGDLSSTNILKFVNHFEGNDDLWIDEISDKL